MSTTPNMSLVVPDVGTSGPTYATQINSALDVIDAHDHTPGKGARIPPSGLNINADLPFNGNDAVSLRSTRYVAQTGTLAASDDRNCVSSVNGNLYWNNSNGVPVQITAGNGLNFASLGTIGGDYGAAGVTASAVYTDSLKTFSWLQAASTFAKMAVGDLALYSTTASTQAVSIKASASTAAYDYIFPITAPAANTFMRMALGGQGTFVTVNGTANQITVTQNASDMTFSVPSNAILPGGVPIGSIVAIGDSGAWALPASGSIKDGWALCNGQAKPVGSDAGLGANLPNLTDDRFLNGSTVAGGTGGATSKTTTGIAASFNKNILNSDQVGHTHTVNKDQWNSNQNAHNHETGTFVTSDANGAWNPKQVGFMWGSASTGPTPDIGQWGSYAGISYISGNVTATQSGTVPSTSLWIYKQKTASSSVSWASANVTSSSSTASWNSAIASVTIDTQGTISDIRPKYFNVVYIMRVA